jgi:outer membrane protein assembly factor BamB
MFRVERRSRPAAGVALLALIVVLLAGCDWTQARFGPDHTGFNPGETTISRANVSGLGVRWSAPLGGGSAPVVAEGVLYVSSGKLYALDASTGSARWRSQGLGDVVSSPAVAGAVVYVSGLKDGNAWLYAVDATSGSLRWSQNIGNVWPTSPTVVDGVVFANGDQLYAFNATTGARLWSAVRGTEEYFYDSPTVAGGVAYVGGNKLYAFNATTGARLWSAPSPGDYFYSPAVARGVAYVGSHEGLFAFNAATGAQLWSAEPGVGTNEVPAVANGVVYIGADKLYAFNAATGAQLWSAGPPSGVSSPVVANGVVYAGHDQVHAFDATTGAQLWSAGAANAPPVVANGAVYVVNRGLSAYGLPGGPPQLSMSPAFPDDFVFGTPGSSARTFTITNLGSTPTSALTDGLSGPDAAHFRLISDRCAGTILAGRASCTVTVSFTPTRSGPRTAWLTAAAATGGAVRAQLTGTAQPFTLSPSTRNFGDLFEGATSSASFTVTNLTDKTVGQLTNSITPAGGFSRLNDACAGRLIAPAASCTFSVRFAPTAGVTYASSLVAEVPGYAARASLAGRGLSRLAIAPSSKSFGPLAPGTTASASFTVTNVSPAAVGPITDTLVYVYGPDGFTITSDTCAGRSLPPSASCAVVVAYAPVTYGFRQAQLRTAAPLAGSAASMLLGGI